MLISLDKHHIGGKIVNRDLVYLMNVKSSLGGKTIKETTSEVLSVEKQTLLTMIAGLDTKVKVAALPLSSKDKATLNYLYPDSLLLRLSYPIIINEAGVQSWVQFPQGWLDHGNCLVVSSSKLPVSDVEHWHFTDSSTNTSVYVYDCGTAPLGFAFAKALDTYPMLKGLSSKFPSSKAKDPNAINEANFLNKGQIGNSPLLIRNVSVLNSASKSAFCKSFSAAVFEPLRGGIVVSNALGKLHHVPLNWALNLVFDFVEDIFARATKDGLGDEYCLKALCDTVHHRGMGYYKKMIPFLVDIQGRNTVDKYKALKSSGLVHKDHLHRIDAYSIIKL